MKTLFDYNRLLIVFGLIASVCFLWLAAVKLDWTAVQDAFSRADWCPWLVLAALFYVAGHLMRGFRLKQLIKADANLSLITCCNIVLTGYAANNVLPVRLGEFVRAGVLVDRTGLSYVRSFTITFIERLLDGLAILLIFAITSFFLPVFRTMVAVQIIATIILGSAFLLVCFVACFPRVISRVVSGIFARFGAAVHDRALSCVSQISYGVASLRSPSNALFLFGITMCVWVLEAGLFGFTFGCFHLPLNALKALSAMAATNLGILIPGGPGFIGHFHYFLSESLINFGVAREIAVSDAIVTHLIFYVIVSIWGVAAMGWYGFQLGKINVLLSQAQSIETLPAGVKGRVIAPAVAVTAVQAAQLPFWQALVEALVRVEDLPMSKEDAAKSLREAAIFLSEQLACLPMRLKSLLHVGLFGFKLFVGITQLRPFCFVPLEKRRQVVKLWAYGKVPLTRQLFRPIRSLALLAFYEQPPVKAALDEAIMRKSHASEDQAQTK